MGHIAAGCRTARRYSVGCMSTHFQRDAVSRALQFIELARKCSMSERGEHEMFLEAVIVFGRTTLHRVHSKFEHAPGWTSWWDGLRGDPSVEFLRRERDFLLKEAPTKVGQVSRVGRTPSLAQHAYYFDNPEIPATETVWNHLERMQQLVQGGRHASDRKTGRRRRECTACGVQSKRHTVLPCKAQGLQPRLHRSRWA
jgi:hypothetical protein